MNEFYECALKAYSGQKTVAHILGRDVESRGVRSPCGSSIMCFGQMPFRKCHTQRVSSQDGHCLRVA